MISSFALSLLGSRGIGAGVGMGVGAGNCGVEGGKKL
jgi:hypothetical protein